MCARQVCAIENDPLACVLSIPGSKVVLRALILLPVAISKHFDSDENPLASVAKIEEEQKNQPQTHPAVAGSSPPKQKTSILCLETQLTLSVSFSHPAHIFPLFVFVWLNSLFKPDSQHRLSHRTRARSVGLFGPVCFFFFCVEKSGTDKHKRIMKPQFAYIIAPALICITIQRTKKKKNLFFPFCFLVPPKKKRHHRESIMQNRHRKKAP